MPLFEEVVPGCVILDAEPVQEEEARLELVGEVVYHHLGTRRIVDPFWNTRDLGWEGREGLFPYPEGIQRARAIREGVAAVLGHGSVRRYDAIPALESQILRVHSPAMLAKLKTVSDQGGGFVGEGALCWPSSVPTMLKSAGAAIQAVELVCSGRHRWAFPLMRPPGHHASREVSKGFCLVNNAAIAAQFALDNYEIERVMILDLDFHHGDGTQEIFYESPNVFYLSMHYLGTVVSHGGTADQIGRKGGEGFNANVPLPSGVRDDLYLEILEALVQPLMMDYQPELLLVSMGYDTHRGDLENPYLHHRIGGLELSLAAYHGIFRRLAHWARDLENCPLVALLEGGYHPESLAYGIANSLAGLLELPPRFSDPVEPTLVQVRGQAGEFLTEFRKQLGPYWACLS